VKLERKHAVVLLLISVWNVYSYANFARNLYDAWAGGEDRTTGYFVAHIVLIVVNLVIAAYLGRLGWRAWRAGGRKDGSQDETRGECEDAVP
jgi:hypothetical protein